MVSTAPAPSAEGHLAKTPFAHVLVHIYKRKLSGTLVVWQEQNNEAEPQAGQDRIRFDQGYPVAARLISPGSALDRSLLSLFGHRNAPYAFYDTDLVGDSSTVLKGRVDPYFILAAALRGSVRERSIAGVLDQLKEHPIRMRSGTDLSRFGFLSHEMAFVNMMRAAPASVPELVTASGDESISRRVIYLLAITGAIEPFESEPQASIPPQSDAPRGSFPPSERLSKTSGVRSPSRTSPGQPAGHRGADDNEPPPDAPLNLTGEALKQWNEVCKRALSIDEMNYFQMLGVNRDVEPAELRDAYFAMAKKWHPDRLPPDLRALRPWADRIFHNVTVARDTLADPDKRRDYGVQVDAGGGTPAAARHVNNIVTAALEFQKVEVYLKRRDWDSAGELLENSLRLNPEEADYWAARAWVRFNSTRDRAPDYPAIHQDLDQAQKLESRNERMHYYRGVVYKDQGKISKALTEFKKAVDKNPRHLEAMREIRLATMRGQSSRPPKPNKDTGILSKLFGSSAPKKK